MAITRDKKNSLVTKLEELFSTAKGIVGAVYTGLNVADMQELRALARESDVKILIVKNRLVRVALGQNDKFKSADTSSLTGQLVYAFSNVDEVAPAQILARFAKKHPELKLALGFSGDGSLLDETTVKMLAELPSKDQLYGQLIGILQAPLSQFMSVALGTQRGFTQVLAQRAESI